jgi:hypothetical protein
VKALDPVLLDKHFLRKHGVSAYYGQKAAATKEGPRKKR